MDLNRDLKDQVVELLTKAFKQSFPEFTLNAKEIKSYLSLPPQFSMGHYAFACFPFAKTLKKGPPQIAAQLSENLPQVDWLESAKPTGPYLNFTFKATSLAKYVLSTVNSKALFQYRPEQPCPKTMIEYSQPNTHKEIHVGHMRNLALGNSLVKILRYLGYPVISATYPGDSGTHVAKALWFLKYKNEEPIPNENKGAWLGEIYVKSTALLEAELGTDKEDQNRVQLTEILAQLEKQNGEFYDLWKETREWSLQQMREIYKWAEVKFDHWYFESEVDSPSLELVKRYYEEGKLTKDQGAIGMDLSEDKLGFCLLIKSDGNGLYATKDLELARRKFEEYNIENNVYVVDNRQSHHFKQVFKVLEKIGFKQAKNCYHLAYDFVELPEGAMSSRKGIVVHLKNLIQNMEETIATNHLQKYQGEWSEEQINQTATVVARGAINYGMLRQDPNKKIVFDMQEWLRLDGESGPYIQYVFARIASLKSKFDFDPNKSIQFELLNHPLENELNFKLGQLNFVLEYAATHYRPSHLCTYLYETAKLFNSFYAECSIGKAPSEELKQARLYLAHCCGEVIKKSLELLGIPAPEKM